MDAENAPFKALNEARTSWIEWGKYMHEIYERNMKIQQTSGFHVDDDSGLDLMAALVKNSTGKVDGLSESEIMGNSFVMFLAGHETAANTIHFSILFLALRPDLQKRLQGEMTMFAPIHHRTNTSQLSSTTYSKATLPPNGTTIPTSHASSPVS